MAITKAVLAIAAIAALTAFSKASQSVHPCQPCAERKAKAVDWLEQWGSTSSDAGYANSGGDL